MEPHTDTIGYKELLEKHPLLWGYYYCERHFQLQTPEFHRQIIEAVQKHDRVVIAAPRESSKSTLVSFLYLLYAICTGKVHFAAIVSNTYKKAAGALENIKKEIRENDSLKAHYPITIRRDAEGDSIFVLPDGKEVRVLCKGADQIGSIRGEKFGPHRFGLVVGDDCEDDEMVRNPERRRTFQELFDDALTPSVEYGNSKIIVIGTILHDDSLLAKLVSPDHYPEYTKFTYRALNTNGAGREYSLWPQKWSVEDLHWIRTNKPNTFAREMQNDPASGTQGQFNKEDFRYWRIENLNYILFDTEGNVVARDLLTTCRAAIACDLAWSEKRSSDYAVIMPGFLTPNSDLLIEQYICKKGLRPDEIEEILFSMEERMRSLTGSSVPIGFEKAMYERVAQWELRRAMRRRNHYLLFKPIQWESDKVTRILTILQPRYAQHCIYHRHDMGELEHQLVRFPSATHDDLPDAAQILVKLLSSPKARKQTPTPGDQFEWWRQQAIQVRSPKRKGYVFGRKGKGFSIPAKEAPPTSSLPTDKGGFY